MKRRKLIGEKGTLRLSFSARTGAGYVGILSRHLRRAHGLLKPPLAELSVALVGRRRMALLHEQFMDIAGETDVLTFELDHNSRGRVIGGEVVICVPVALQQARRHKTRPAHEVLLYAIHGMLHLCRFDDKTPRESATMHRMEDKILTRLGIGRVYNTSRPGGG